MTSGGPADHIVDPGSSGDLSDGAVVVSSPGVSGLGDLGGGGGPAALPLVDLVTGIFVCYPNSMDQKMYRTTAEAL